MRVARQFLLLASLCHANWFWAATMCLLWGIIAASAVAALALLLHHAIRYKNRITCSSIREAMDGLPVAGCFFTTQGRVKLCNRQIYRLYRVITGGHLQKLSELRQALAHHDDYGIPVTWDGSFVFPDRRMWFYREAPTVTPLGTYMKAYFIDATECSKTNAELVQGNRKLEEINAKLQKMYIRAEDRIRERKYLAFKMKTHDEIGRSLTMIRQVLQSNLSGTDIEAQVNTLSLAAGTLTYSPGQTVPIPSTGFCPRLQNWGAIDKPPMFQLNCTPYPANKRRTWGAKFFYLMFRGLPPAIGTGRPLSVHQSSRKRMTMAANWALVAVP